MAPNMTDLEAATTTTTAAAANPKRLGRGESVLETRTDPFAPREGKTLVWRNVNMRLAAARGNGEKDRLLLDSVWGEVPAKETTAIMGPSGAGKSSLLNILAGRARSRGRLSISADIRLNNYAVDPTKIEVRQHIAFVAQDDSLQVTATPREAIRFSAKLRLPRSTKESQLDKLTERMLTELGLTECADTVVGGELIKGISGGERKRTSVGVELVTKPALVFLDEPTSGLDSFSAVQLCQVLKKVANAGASVLFTIHQPSSEIFNSFDHLILLNKGRCMYQGSVAGVPDYFAAKGHPCPPHYNPADWIMYVAQSTPLEELGKAQFFPRDEREMEEPFEADGTRNALGMSLTKRRGSAVGVPLDESTPGIGTQTLMLFEREFKNLTRDTTSLIARFSITIFLSVLVGTLFLDVGETNPLVPVNLQSHFGALIMTMLMSMFGTAQPTLLSFPAERPVFLREYSTNHYSVLSYFVSKFCVEASITAAQVLVQCVITYFMIGFQASFGIYFASVYTLAMASTALAVFLGCSVGDPKLGQELLPLLFVPQMLFAGFFVAPDLIPIWLRWPQYLCTLTYSLRIIMVAEFYGCGAKTLDLEASLACDQLLENVGADPDDTWWYWIVLVALFAAFRLLGLFVLRKKATVFL